MTINLKNKAISGIFWNGLAKFSTQFIQLIIMAVLARLLLPSDFGIIGTTFIFTRFITLINEMGIAAAIVQRKEIDDDDITTLYVACLVMGLGLSAILFFTSPLLARFYNLPILAPVLKLSSITLIIGALGVIYKAWLLRMLDFKSIAIVEIAGISTYGLLSIILAKMGLGVWSIVWGNIGLHTVNTILYWIKVDWRARIYFSLKRFKNLINFGLNYLGTNLVNYTNFNLASFVIGKFVGMSSLGIYEISNNVTNQTVGRLSFIIGRVMFPTLSKIQDDNERFANVFLKVLLAIAVIAFPLLIGLIVIAKPMVLVVFGQKWESAIFPIQVLAAVSIVRSVGRTVGFVLQAKGRSDIEFKWNLVYMTAFLTLLIINTKYGLNGVLLSIAIITFIGSPIIQKISFSLIDLNLTTIIKTLAPVLFSAILMGITVFAFDHLLFFKFRLEVQLLLSILVGVISYGFYLFIFGQNRIIVLKESISDSILGEKFSKMRNQFKMGAMKL